MFDIEKVRAKRWQEKHQDKIDRLTVVLEKKNRVHLLGLLAKIRAKAAESEVYRNRVIAWLEGERTFAHVTSLCAPFAKLDDLVTRNNIYLLNRILISLS